MALPIEAAWRARLSPHPHLSHHPDGSAPHLPPAGDNSAAEALLQRMGTLGLQPDTVTFASLMDPARSAPPSQAVSWLQSMQQAGVEPDTLCYNKVIASYARARLPEVAQEWLETMREAGVPPTVVSYSTSINGYAKTAQPAQAVALLRQMAQFFWRVITRIS